MDSMMTGVASLLWGLAIGVLMGWAFAAFRGRSSFENTITHLLLVVIFALLAIATMVVQVYP